MSKTEGISRLATFAELNVGDRFSYLGSHLVYEKRDASTMRTLLNNTVRTIDMPDRRVVRR